MKNIVLLSTLIILSCTSLNAMETILSRTMSLLPKGKLQITALAEFPKHFETAFFNTNVVGGKKRIRWAKTYLNEVSILLDSLSEVFPTITIDQLPTVKDSTNKDVNLAQQTKSVLTTWGLSMEPQKDPTDPAGKRIVWTIVGAAKGPGGNGTVAALQTEVSNLKAQLAAAKPEAPKDLPTAVAQAKKAAKDVYDAIKNLADTDPKKATALAEVAKIIEALNTGVIK